jgi:hypothetical protein
MEIADVRRKVLDAIARARRAAAERRVQVDEAGRDYEIFLERVAVPLFRQVVNILRAEHFPFAVATPAGSVRMMSETSADDYIELTLDTGGDSPRVVGHVSRSRGRRRIETEWPLGAAGPIRDLTEEDVLEFLVKELQPFVEK